MEDREKLENIIKYTLDKLNFNKQGVWSGDKYVINLEDSNEFSRLYTALDKCEDADLDIESMVMSDSSSIIVYLTDDLDITLKANFDEDKYYLILEGAVLDEQ